MIPISRETLERIIETDEIRRHIAEAAQRGEFTEQEGKEILDDILTP